MSFAAERTGIARNTVYLRRKADPAFALGWEKAMVMAAEVLRDAAVARAHDGTEPRAVVLLRQAEVGRSRTTVLMQRAAVRSSATEQILANPCLKNPNDPNNF